MKEDIEELRRLLQADFPKYRLSIIMSSLVRMLIMVFLWAVILIRHPFGICFVTFYLLSVIIVYCCLELIGVLAKLQRARRAMDKTKNPVELRFYG